MSLGTCGDSWLLRVCKHTKQPSQHTEERGRRRNSLWAQLTAVFESDSEATRTCAVPITAEPAGGHRGDESRRFLFPRFLRNPQQLGWLCLQHCCGAVRRASRAGIVSIPFVGCPQAVIRGSKDYHRKSRSKNVARY